MSENANIRSKKGKIIGAIQYSLLIDASILGQSVKEENPMCRTSTGITVFQATAAASQYLPKQYSPQCQNIPHKDQL